LIDYKDFKKIDMKHCYKYLMPFAFVGLISLPIGNLMAGNPDRVGQEGATELLINPWARSSGWAGSNVSGARGLESMFTNVAGTAFTKKTELLFAHTQWLKGSDININSFGLIYDVGYSLAVGLSIISLEFGFIQVTITFILEEINGLFSP